MQAHPTISSLQWLLSRRCIKCHNKLDVFAAVHQLVVTNIWDVFFVRSKSCLPVLIFSLLQHNPRADRPGQPTARTGLPEERGRTLHGFRQMDKSAQHSQPSNCQQADMMACSRQGKRHASNTSKLCFRARGVFPIKCHLPEDDWGLGNVFLSLLCAHVEAGHYWHFVFLLIGPASLVLHTNASDGRVHKRKRKHVHSLVLYTVRC